MSTIDLCEQHFSSDGGLWVVPNRIQQTRDRVTGRLTGIWEETVVVLLQLESVQLISES